MLDAKLRLSKNEAADNLLLPQIKLLKNKTGSGTSPLLHLSYRHDI